MIDFPEKDWRIFRDVSQIALDRFFSSILDEASKIATDQSRPPGERYRSLYKFIKERDREVALAFNNPDARPRCSNCAACVRWT
jgi:hypothetical protein